MDNLEKKQGENIVNTALNGEKFLEGQKIDLVSLLGDIGPLKLSQMKLLLDTTLGKNVFDDSYDLVNSILFALNGDEFKLDSLSSNDIDMINLIKCTCYDFLFTICCNDSDLCIDLGIKYSEIGYVDNALKCYIKAYSYKKHKQDLGLLFNILLAYLDKGDSEKIVARCDRVLLVNPKDYEIIKMKLGYMNQLKKYDKVIEFCNTMNFDEIDNELCTDILSRLVLAYYESGKFKDVLRLINEFSYIFEDNGDDKKYLNIYSFVLKSLFNLKKYGLVIKIANSLLKHYPDNVFLILFIGKSYHNMHKYKTAWKYFDEALIREPMNMDVLFGMGVCCYSLNDFVSANIVFNTMIDNGNDSIKVLENKIYCCFKLGLYDEVISVGKKYVELDEKNKVIWDIIGDSFYFSGRYFEAIDAYKNSLKIDNKDLFVIFNIGYSYSIIGDSENTIKYFKMALRLKPDYSSVAFELSEIYFRNGDINKGLKVFKKYIWGNFSGDIEKEIFESLSFMKSCNKFPKLRKSYIKGINSRDLFLASSNHFISVMNEKIPYHKKKPLRKGIFDKVSDLSTEIINQNGGKIKNESIVVVPMYVKENISKLIEQIAMQGGDHKIYIYINGFEPKCDEEELQRKLNRVNTLVKKNGLEKRTIVLSNLYSKRLSIGAIRADMIDGLILAMDESVKDPIIISLDADVYKLQDGYIQGVVDKFKSDPEICYLKGQLRRNQHNEHNNYVWFSEKIGILAEGRNALLPGSGASSNYRLMKYMKVGGYDRGIKLGEDVNLGYKMVYRFGSPYVGALFGKKVWTDPRRGEKIMISDENMTFFDQWQGEFSHVDKSKVKLSRLDKLHDIFGRFRDGGVLSGDEISLIIEKINLHVGGNLKCINKLIRFWNFNMLKSKYKLGYYSEKIYIVKKLR